MFKQFKDLIFGSNSCRIPCVFVRCIYIGVVIHIYIGVVILLRNILQRNIGIYILAFLKYTYKRSNIFAHDLHVYDLIPVFS